MTTIYIAELAFGRPTLIEAEVGRETPKTYVLAHHTVLLGGKAWVNRVIKKDWAHEKLGGIRREVFSTLREAVTWLIGEADAEMYRLTAEQAAVQALRDELTQALTAQSEAPEAAAQHWLERARKAGRERRQDMENLPAMRAVAQRPALQEALALANGAGDTEAAALLQEWLSGTYLLRAKL